MPPTSSLDWALLQRLTGRATDDEVQAVAQWTAPSAPGSDRFDRLASAWAHWDAGSRPRDAAWHAAAWRTLTDRLQAENVLVSPARSDRRDLHTPASPSDVGIQRPRLATRTHVGVRSKLSRRVVGYAAGLVGALLIGLVAPREWRTIRHALSPSTTREYATRRAERSTVVLPDGSYVILGPESRVRYASAGANGARTVELEGQAYFTVAHGADRPFTVRAGALTTRVLGTSFTVRAYANDRSQQVAVAEGKVEIGMGDTSLVLVAGDVGSVRDGGALHLVRDARITDVLGWTRGEFRLRDVTLREVAFEIERQYGVTVQFSTPQVAARIVTVAFMGQSVDDLTAAVATIADATVSRHGNTFLFAPADR